MSKKSFGSAIKGADKLFSVNDPPTDTVETPIIDDVIDTTTANTSVSTLENLSPDTKANVLADTLSDTIPNTNSNTLARRVSNRKSNTIADVLANIPAKDPPGKSYSYHLSPDTATAVAREAKKRKISKSKLVDIILRQVLIGGNEE